jgi:cytochrome b561
MARSSPAPPRAKTRYGSVAQALHWLTATLALAAFILGPGGSEQRVYSPGNGGNLHLHEALGTTVLALTILRLLWRTAQKPPTEPPMPAWMRNAAAVTHHALYLLLFLTPLTAIVGAWLEGHDIAAFGFVALPSPIAVSHATGAVIANLHGWLGDAIIWLAGLHAAAALFHHVILRDRVLRMMLPFHLGTALPPKGRPDSSC